MSDRTLGRRASSAVRRDPLALVAVLLPMLAVLGALLVHTDPGGSAPRTPVVSALSRAVVACPDADAPAVAASFSEASGALGARVGDAEETPVRIEPRRPVTVPSSGRRPVVLTGTDALAPGLVAGRFTSSASAPCRPPAFDEWFTGVGSGAKHSSTLELVNPDAGRALVSVDVLSTTGPVEVSKLRGIAVPPHGSVSLDLGALVPRTDDLALHVQVLRGRAVADVRDAFDRLGGLGRGEDWLLSQPAPSGSNLMLGVPPGGGRRVLVIANPGESQGRATIRLVDEASTFAPEGMDDVIVPARSVVRVKLGPVLKQAGQKKGERLVGLQVDSTVPVTTDVLQFIGTDLSHAVPVTPIEQPGAAVLPDGDKRLLLGGAVSSGAVTVDLWDARGRPLRDLRVAVTAGNGSLADLPAKARLVALSPSQTRVQAVVLVTTTGKDGGTAVVPIREPERTGRVPAVRPGLP